MLCVIFQEARQKFRSVLLEATVKLDDLVKKIGKAVDESKPYWEARRLARQVRHLGRGRGCTAVVASPKTHSMREV